MRRFLTTLIVAASVVLTAGAEEFFSTAKCDHTFDLGVRFGVNTTNRTVNNSAVRGYNHQSWGTGLDLGVVADINIREYLSIQPGFFFESRSGEYAFVTSDSYVYYEEGEDVGYHYDPSAIMTRDNTSYNDEIVTQLGHRHTYNFTIPVVASVRFNLLNNLKWTVDFGPYISFLLSSKYTNKELVSTLYNVENNIPFQQKPSTVDFGFKMGTGFELNGHYYAGIHYEAGAVNAYKDRKMSGYKQIYGGRTKAWMFTVGYNF